MQSVLDRIDQFAGERPSGPALTDGHVCLDYLELRQEIERVAATLYLRRIGLLLGNGCAWAVLDLAAQRQGAVCIPLPPFFSDNQLRHLIRDSGIEVVITDQPARLLHIVKEPLITEIVVASKRLGCFVIMPEATPTLAPPISKITYTSGSTGQPRGVCLTGVAITRVTVSLIAAVGANAADKAITLLPLSTLLANIAGLYAPLYCGGTACVPDLAQCGLAGSTGVRADRLVEALRRNRPSVTVLVPHLLKSLVEAGEAKLPLPSSLRYIAVGGAPLSGQLLQRAHALGLPVYQGYGLSEAASVLTLNAPGADRPGSVGRPLPHVKLRIAADGEIMVGGNLFSGYLGAPPRKVREWATGDTGFVDADGYLYVTGRKKTAFATAHGRNVAPEWIESELTSISAIAQAALFGEGRASNVAVVVLSSTAAAARIGPVIGALNRTLPDYARVNRWIIADEPFSTGNGLANGAGVLNRQAIAARYWDQIDQAH